MKNGQRCHVPGFEDTRRMPEAKECGLPLEPEKNQGNKFSLRDPRREHTLANTLILAH